MADFPTSGYPPMIGRMLNIPQWIEYVRGYDFGPISPTRLVLHHTYRPNEAEWRGLTSMRGMQKYYAGLGWSAAPHIYVGPDGIWLFTPMSEVGIHAGTGNSGVTGSVWWYSIGLEMVGYFDYARPSGAVWTHAKTVMGTLSQRLRIPPRQLISFHRDYTNQKSCPGWAITKDWVVGEIEAWLNNSTPPPPPDIPPVGKPTPADEVILERLLNESYTRRSKGYNVDWAFHQYAVQHGMGAPMADSKRITVDGKEYSYQPFARDTLYSLVPNWGTVLLLSRLLSGNIPPRGLGRVLLESIYRDGGATFHADWAFHQYATITNLGPPIGESNRIMIDGVEYAFQVFASDTLYNRIPDWGNVQQLSRLATTTDPARVRLREALLVITYRRGGANYNPNWSFHQLARQWSIGAPLGDPYGIYIEGVNYNIQAYALDTIYNIVPYWTDVQRLSRLIAAQHPGTNRALSLEEPPDLPRLPPDVQWESRRLLPYTILHYTSTPPPTAYSERSGSRVSLVVLHGDAGPAQETLKRMSEPGASDSTHYYLAADATVYRLIPEERAAWHAGMLTYNGRRQNINRISIGIVLERPPDLSADSPAGQRQRCVLGWLIKDIFERYHLGADAVVRWLDMQPDRVADHSSQRLDDVTLETITGP